LLSGKEYMVERMKDRRRDCMREWGDPNPYLRWNNKTTEGPTTTRAANQWVHCNVNEMNIRLYINARLLSNVSFLHIVLFY
jgi:hypothetical protein